MEDAPSGVEAARRAEMRSVGVLTTHGALEADVAARRFAGPCLIVQIDRHARPAADLERLASAYPSATVQSAQEEAFWKEIPRFYQDAPHLFEITTAWLGAH